MKIDFVDDELESICKQKKLAVRKFGVNCARKLRTRLADLVAATNVRELVTGRPHPLKGEKAGQFALDLHGGVRLVFEPANEPVPIYEDGGINWAHVTQVRIIYIGDYHD